VKQGLDLGFLMYKYRLNIAIKSTGCLLAFFIYDCLVHEVFLFFNNLSWLLSLYEFALLYLCTIVIGWISISYQKKLGISEQGGDQLSTILEAKFQAGSNQVYEDAKTGSSSKLDVLFKLSTQAWLLLIPIANFWIIGALALGNLARPGSAAGSKAVKLIVSICICTAVLGIALEVYIIVLIKLHLMQSSLMPLLVGLYVCTLLMGISYIICQKVLGVGE